MSNNHAPIFYHSIGFFTIGGVSLADSVYQFRHLTIGKELDFLWVKRFIVIHGLMGSQAGVVVITDAIVPPFFSNTSYRVYPLILFGGLRFLYGTQNVAQVNCCFLCHGLSGFEPLSGCLLFYNHSHFCGWESNPRVLPKHTSDLNGLLTNLFTPIT